MAALVELRCPQKVKYYPGKCKWPRHASQLCRSTPPCAFGRRLKLVYTDTLITRFDKYDMTKKDPSLISPDDSSDRVARSDPRSALE